MLIGTAKLSSARSYERPNVRFSHKSPMDCGHSCASIQSLNNRTGYTIRDGRATGDAPSASCRLPGILSDMDPGVKTYIIAQCRRSDDWMLDTTAQRRLENPCLAQERANAKSWTTHGALVGFQLSEGRRYLTG